MMRIESSWSGHYAEPTDLSCGLSGKEGSLYWPSGDFYANEISDSMQTIPTVPFGEKPHFEAIRSFYEAIRDGKPSPIPWRETYWVIAIIEALYRSAEEKREIEISPQTPNGSEGGK